MENVTFGELAASPGSRWSTRTGSDGYRLSREIIDTFERMCIFPREIMRGTDNLYNYNIYIYIYKNIKDSTTS